MIANFIIKEFTNIQTDTMGHFPNSANYPDVVKMKTEMTIEKKAKVTIDLAKERKRINRAFASKKDEKTKQMLHKLMDLIEQEKWEEAKKEIEGKWWIGRDKKRECPRREFIGYLNCVDNDMEFFDSSASYENLVYAFVNWPNNYKVIKIL